jgi:hypothetical protein
LAGSSWDLDDQTDPGLNVIDINCIPWFLNNNYSFFGDGTDGAATISSDTVIDGTKHYTNLTIDITKKLQKTPGPEPLIIFCTGNLVMNGIIDMTGRGAAGGQTTGVAGCGQHGFSALFGGQGGTGKSNNTAAGGGGAAQMFGSKSPFAFAPCGAGGGSSGNVSSGAGGAGAGGLMMFVKGTVTFGVDSKFDFEGTDGSAGGGAAGGGGGGGGGGYMWLRHLGALTDNGVEYDFTGGAGGSGTGAGVAGTAGAAGKYVIENMSTRSCTTGP